MSSGIEASNGSVDEDENELNDNELEAIRNSYLNSLTLPPRSSEPEDSPILSQSSVFDLRLSRAYSYSGQSHERSQLLAHADGSTTSYQSTDKARPKIPSAAARSRSYNNSIRGGRSRRNSIVRKYSQLLDSDARNIGPQEAQAVTQALYVDDRRWYDQFTSTDWVYDSIDDAHRVTRLKRRKGLRARAILNLDRVQGWLLSLLIGCVTAALAYLIDIVEASVFDFKSGYCSTRWWLSERQCCNGAVACDQWAKWSSLLSIPAVEAEWVEFGIFVAWVVVLALLACVVTLQTRTTISSALSLSTLDENLAAAPQHDHEASNLENYNENPNPVKVFHAAQNRPPVVYYPAAGSGVAEVRVILSGFVLHGYLGMKTLLTKAIALILSVASGLSIGKEGPYVHIATCVGNISCRLSPKYNKNDSKRREILSAAAAAGVAVAFGAPIGGVLFSLEEVSYYFPRKTLFRTFFCTIAATLSLKFLNPYGTNQVVLFEVRYLGDWRWFELVVFSLLGVLGGALGAFFIKASRFWAQKFRSLAYIKEYPLLEVGIVALITGLVTYWNRYTRLPVAGLLYELAAPCHAFSSSGDTLCPTEDKIPAVIATLSIAFVVKAILTTVTFGIKVPAGIYVPSMVVGGFLGRITGHALQALALTYPERFGCPADGNPESCVVPGVYALVAAGATMCGVTRLSVTLAVILFELTGSLAYVLPFSLGVLMAKWTADALEPLSIYDLLTDMNAYPYLDSKDRPTFTTELGDITPPPDPNRFVDISTSPLVPAHQLRMKLQYMQMAGELDGGLPILRGDILVGMISGPSLEFALDNLRSAEESVREPLREQEILCRMDRHQHWLDSYNRSPDPDRRDSELEPSSAAASLLSPPERPRDPTDFGAYIDPAPVALDVCSSMDLVFECFVKLGLRYICVLREGKYAGLLHKKPFVRYVKALQKEE